MLPLRLKYPELDQTVDIAVLWGTLLAFGVGAACLPVRRWLQVICSVPFFVAVVIFPVSLFVAMIGGGPIVGFEVLDTVELPHSKIVAYRLNGGATTDSAIKVSQELTIFPGVVVAKDLHNGYSEYKASVKSFPNTVVVTIDGVTTEYTVRPFIYF